MFNPNVEKHRLNPTIEATILMLKIQAQTRGITLIFNKLEGPDNVLIDKIRIQQILINLIHNSIKFSKADSSIKVTIEGSQLNVPPGHISVNIKVTDNGIGISEEDRQNLFNEYFKT